jgi:hypothetical protein
MMKRYFLGAIVLTFGLLLLGCGEEQEVQRPEEKAQQLVSQALDAGEGTAPGGEMVEVTAEGNKLEPPVQIGQIPAGAWYCDMGTVHYARKDEGDGRCTVCGMTLTKKGG